MAPLGGDIRTLVPYFRHRLRGGARPLPPAEPFRATVEDADVGPVRLSGWLRAAPPPGGRDLVLVLHGLGGTTESYYCQRAVRAIAAAGRSSLCLSLRGADRAGEDFYNIALTADLHASLAAPELADFERVLLTGYSMGGHVALHYACEPGDPRVRGVAAICTPLDLAVSQRYIDSPRAWPYRRHVLDGLKEIYAAVALRREVPTDPARVRRVRTIREWDELTVVPRYGFASPEDYYRELSVGARLAELRLPALLVASRQDPVVPADSIAPFVDAGDGAADACGTAAAGRLEPAWVERGGHVAFARDLDLGFGPRTGLDRQLLHWFDALG